MSYPPPGGYPPYPPQQQAPNLGFSANPGGPGQGPNYPLFPQGGANPSPYPPAGGGPPQSMGYPTPGGYPAPGGGPYPPQNAPYPGSSPYPPAPGSSPYPPAPGSSPYPPAQSSSPYPPAPGSSPYTPESQAAYPPSNASPYPSTQGSSAYPSVPATTDYMAAGGNPGQSPYPSVPQAGPYPGSQPANPYPSGGSYPGAVPGSAGGYPGAPYGQGAPANLGGGMLYSYEERPTVRPSSSFDPSGDSALLRKAMKGFGTDEKAIIAILGRRTSDQRQHILMKYQQSYGRDLIKDLASELGGRFEQVILSLMVPQPTYLAKELQAAMKGIGTKERALIEILCTSNNYTLRAIKAAYQTTFGHPLEKDISGDTSGDFGRLLISMCAACRDETPANPSLAPGLAQSLYKAGEKKVGTDEAEFNRILSSYSYPMLRCVFDEYHKIKGKSFETAIKSELSGDFRDGMLALYQVINNKSAFFATELYNAMKGMGTKDGTLIRIVVTRCEIDMGNIKQEFFSMYNKRLEDAIKSETSGDYKNILMALVQD